MTTLRKLSKEKRADHVDMQTNLQSLIFRFLGRQTLTSLPGRPGTGNILYAHRMPEDGQSARRVSPKFSREQCAETSERAPHQ